MLILVSGAGGLHSRAQAPDGLDTIRKFIVDGRYVQAEAAARDQLAATEGAARPDSLQTARILDALVEALWRGGKVRAPETKALAERAIAIKEAQRGAQHPDVAYSLATLGIVLRLQGDFQTAKSMFDRALAIQEQALGPAHPDVARTLTSSAVLSADRGDLTTAQALQERALASRLQALPSGDPAVAENFNGLGVILERRGDNGSAERYHQQALAIREKALGAAHPDVAASLNNLGNIRSRLGDYAAARSFHERALAIREKALGFDHPDVAGSLNNLAIAVRDLGDHAAAWRLLERVLGIYERAFGPDHPNVALTCHNLAALLLDLGDQPGARLLAERARRFRDRTGTDDAFVTQSLNPLVGMDPPFQSSVAARALFERALTIKEKTLGPDHTSVALTLTSLANVHKSMGERASARPLYERALAIREKALGPAHPDVADTLDRLGELLVEEGDHAGARQVFERALGLYEQVYGPDHPWVGNIRQHLAELLATVGDTADALRMALETERIGLDHLRLIGRTLPEREALSYATTMRPVGLDVALTLVARGESRPGTSIAAVWDAVVRSRAVVLDEMASRHRAVGASDRPDLARLANDLAAKREQLATLVVRGPGSSWQQYRVELQRARDERDDAERALAERSLEFRGEQRQQGLGLEDVEAALPPRSALIAFVRYQQHPFGRPSDTGTASPRPAGAYVAFVTRAGEPGKPAIVPLGPAADLESELAGWRKQMTAVAFAGGRSTTRAEAAIREAGSRLRAKIWDPLIPELGDVSRIFIVPDGPLHLVTWEALPAAGAAYLIEQAPLLHYLSAERDLVPREKGASGHGLLVIDSPVFNDAPARAVGVRDTAAGGSSAANARAEGGGFRGLQSNCADFRSMRFDPLPAAAREADTIAGIWRRSRDAGPQLAAAPGVRSRSDDAVGLVRLSGRAATETALKQRATGARVLHLATHGFFLGGQCASALARTSDKGGHDFAASSDVAENPLLLAGFALTGANRPQTGARDGEDGILTAEEVAALDLRGVEWAVLSACDTGVGEIRAGEGVFGLRRAFQMAGARTVIMSLWPVGDEDSRRWMTGLYDRRFVRGAGTMEAVRESSLEQLQRRRRAGSSTHPFYWAGFIAAGDWR
jgi:CHAT domain-containing protein/tetratricopeptide (TPR) repeat protein